MKNKPQDNFKEYFTEKLWEMIPAVYRHEDGIAANPGVLRAFIEILAEQAAVVRRSHDRLWDDQFIELCDDWAIPYIADLVGTRLVSALNKRGRRVDVAKTIYYRRRKGTLRVLEELISDIAGWEGTVVENFRRLGRTRHGLDPPPGPLAGRLSGTCPGGWADMRRTRAAELAGGPFDEFHYTPDFRRYSGIQGRYSIPKLAFHLYRIPSFRVSAATPHLSGSSGGFTFDPSGRNIPLFAPRNRMDPAYNWDKWESPQEWELPGTIRCQLLADETARESLIPNAIRVSSDSGDPYTPDKVAAANLAQWNVPNVAWQIEIAIDSERGRFMFTDGATDYDDTVDYHYGFSGEIGAGTYPRNHVETISPVIQKEDGDSILAADLPSDGVFQIDDSATYDGIPNPLDGIVCLIIQAANLMRPYVRMNQPWVLASGCALGSTGGRDSILVIDGLWLGGGHPIVLDGDYEQVIIRHTTLDPGEESPAGNQIIPPVYLVVRGHIEHLYISKSITGPILSENGGLVEDLKIEDCIIQSIESNTSPVVGLTRSEAIMNRVTAIGDISIKRLIASEVIVTGSLNVGDKQTGCFRFSAAPIEFKNALPKPFKPFWIPESGSSHYFTSKRFGDPEYARLSAAAPAEVRQGAENRSEMGAFSSFIAQIRLASLDTKVNEYLPFGQIPIYITST
jgi:hypothetical protein